MVAPRFYAKGPSPEHYLGVHWPLAVWGAVLTQAIDDVLHGPSLAESKGMTVEQMAAFHMAVQDAAEEWIADDSNEPRRFVWVCEQLGYSPDAVRRSINARRKNA